MHGVACACMVQVLHAWGCVRMHGAGAVCNTPCMHVAVAACMELRVHARCVCCMHGALCACTVWVLRAVQVQGAVQLCMHGVGAAFIGLHVHVRRGCCVQCSCSEQCRCACTAWVLHAWGFVCMHGVGGALQCRCSERCRCACMACVLHAWGFVCMHGVGAACSAGAVSGAGVHARRGCCEHTCMCCRAAAHTEGWGEGMQTAVLFLQQVAAAARCPCASLAARLTRCAIWGGRRGVLRCCRCCRAWGAVPRLCSSAATRLSEGLGAQRRKCGVRLQDLGAGLR